MAETAQIESTYRLLRQTSAALTSSPFLDESLVGFEQSYSNALLEFSGEQEVLWAISHGSEDDTASFSISSHLRKSIADIASRNAKQLAQLHQALAEVCPILYLKGACLMAENDFQPAPWRSMADIDFLVPRDKLGTALEALRALGYRAQTEKYAEKLHAHYPMLKKDGCELGVEVHTRCFRWSTDELLDPERMWERAQTIESSCGPVLVPHINDRIIHLIVHAQIASRRYARRSFLLRDALEFQVLSSRPGADLALIRRMFEKAGYQDEFLAFVRMVDQVMSVQTLETGQYSGLHHQWAADVQSGYEDPTSVQKFHRADVFQGVLSSLFMPSRWTSIIQALVNPNELRDLLNRVSQPFAR